MRERLRDSEVLVYAVGIDGDSLDQFRRTPPQPRIPPRPRSPFPPGGGRLPGAGPGGRLPVFPQIFGPGSRQFPSGNDDRVNVSALRDMTDDSGGRTEVVHTARDLNPATTASGMRSGWSCVTARTASARAGDTSQARISRCLFCRPPWG